MDRVVILDFGSQTTQLIARRVRELEVYCEIVPCTAPVERYQDARAIILSGGPASVHEAGSPRPDKALWSPAKPVLGICSAMQVMVEANGASVTAHDKREFGRAQIDVAGDGAPLFRGLGARVDVWMSHGDQAA